MIKMVMCVATTVMLMAMGTANAKALTAQQEKMATCNKEAAAKALKGDERKAFMKACLSDGKNALKKEEKKLTAQQQKMVDCNKLAKGMSGDARKAFMAKCLKK